MLVHQTELSHKREIDPRSTERPQGFQAVGDVAKSIAKRAILRGYAHRILSLEATQALIDALDLRRA